ncbi:hypothetical protein IGI04_029580 [Brassica rapa subsp. trilocularis]|uniref:Secreted protein n=1 Tax=Brassica rapa subsp. trilocularis TaxID=1813537 RepID=A0ABQ7LN88_BRACM|nr:hypothetical protein IGI04_029580 [Brassica rapa subsp. trilocularis]
MLDFVSAILGTSVTELTETLTSFSVSISSVSSGSANAISGVTGKLTEILVAEFCCSLLMVSGSATIAITGPPAGFDWGSRPLGASFSNCRVVDSFSGAGEPAATLSVSDSTTTEPVGVGGSDGGTFGTEAEPEVDLPSFGGDLSFGPFLLPISE